MINLIGEMCETPLAQNRGFLYADGVFETLKIVNGQILFFEDHYFRLMAAMRIMRMRIPMTFTQDFIKNEILKTLEFHNQSGLIRMTVFRNDGGKYLPHTNEISYVISFKPSESTIYEFEESSQIVDLYTDFYISAQLLSTIKTTAKNINVLASIYAQENNLDNCILLNEKKEVVEFINGNLFLIFDNKIVTPPLSSGCINGIIRKQLLNILSKSNEFKIEERIISPFELQQADEMFLTNINIGIQAISQYRKKTFLKDVSKKILMLVNKL